MPTHHVAAVAESFFLLEFPYAECDWRGKLVNDGEIISSGQLILQDGAGLGLSLNASLMGKHPYQSGIITPREESGADIL